MDDWEMYLHDAAPQLPLLIRCALVHYQFEAIGPFLDGNARLGRLFIILCLVALGRLPLTGGAKPHPSAAAGHKHDGAPHDPL
ncbi:fic/DOC family protein, partial [Mycobacterium tuberculosis variant bovis]